MTWYLIEKVYLHFKRDSLYRNSIYLMISNFTMAVFGFIFWIINARIYPSSDIGLATSLISITTLISTFSMVGLNSGLLRYLPNSKNKNEIINTVFSVSTLVAIVLSVVYIFSIPLFSPLLMTLRNDAIHAALFTLFAIFSTLNLLVDNVFISYRSSGNVLAKSILFSLLKLILPLLLFSLGAFGIFYSVSISLTVGFIAAVIILIYNFSYRIKPQIHKSVISEIATFSIGNYFINIIGSLPTLLMPTIITNSLGPRQAAYYYMPTMIASLLYIIPITVCQSLFTEGVYDKQQVNKLLKKATILILAIIVPFIVGIVFFGQYILLAFGKEYSSDGFGFLRLIILSGLFISFNTIFGTILKIENKLNKVILVSAIGSLTILVSSYMFVERGLTVLGMIWLLGNGLQTLLYVYYLKAK